MTTEAATVDQAPGVVTDNRLRESLAEVFARVPPAWRDITAPFARSDAGRALIAFIDARVAGGAIVYPRHVFHALALTAPRDVRVVVLGQDPYHGAGQAQGLAFSVAPGFKPPPSLRNMLAEVRSDTGAPSICRDDLTPWAMQGVLLLNTVLTVEDGQPHSHANRGWELLTDALLARVVAEPQPIVFLLWGAAAQRKRALIDAAARHVVLAANHPSPLSARRPPEPFIGCRPFSRANAALVERRPGTPPIRW
ncbi:MAG TPA: uracil-DNA glycosylase [Burkholderiaceae bacterium]|nr:uracil-DNA glycosylase [Burkholderiaceae bacterium]